MEKEAKTFYPLEVFGHFQGVVAVALAAVGAFGGVVAVDDAEGDAFDAAGDGAAFGFGEEGSADALAAQGGADEEVGDVGVVAHVVADEGAHAFEGEDEVGNDGAVELGDEDGAGAFVGAFDQAGHGGDGAGAGELAVADQVVFEQVQALFLFVQGGAVGGGGGADEEGQGVSSGSCR